METTGHFIEVCVYVYLNIYRESSFCFSISILRKIRLFKSHYAQLSSVLSKLLYSITSSKSEKGGKSDRSGRWGLLFSHIHSTPQNPFIFKFICRIKFLSYFSSSKDMTSLAIFLFCFTVLPLQTLWQSSKVLSVSTVQW